MNKKWLVKITKIFTTLEFKFDSGEDAMTFLELALVHEVQSDDEDKVTVTIEMAEDN